MKKDYQNGPLPISYSLDFIPDATCNALCLWTYAGYHRVKAIAINMKTHFTLSKNIRPGSGRSSRKASTAKPRVNTIPQTAVMT